MPSLLIDVRTAAEYATGHLGDAINIEYTSIAALTHRSGVAKDDPITLYCRSGRRSAIALQELSRLGFTNLRDIGAFENARRVLGEDEEEQEKGLLVGSRDAAATGMDGEGGKAFRTTSTQEVRSAFDGLVDGLGGTRPEEDEVPRIR